MPPVIAEITTLWDKKGLVPIRINRVINYDITSAMDTDTDSFSVTLGDIDHNLIEMLRRDNEVRVDLYAMGKTRAEALQSGFGDEISLDETGVITIGGRDKTSVAVDSAHPPQVWHQIRPHVLVFNEAKQLRIGQKLDLSHEKGFKKYATDGSESYWQVWYRFYRKRKAWIWSEPDGTIIASRLDYNQKTSYYFGEPVGRVRNAHWIQVENMVWKSNKNQRVGDVFIFGHRGDVGIIQRATDPTTRNWIRRPTLIKQDADVHTQGEARIEAWEEIFETKVGATEITLTIEDPGYIIRQNRMAMVNLPKVGLKGEYYVVGTEIIGDLTSGQYQVVRLREKYMAITNRKPADPNQQDSLSSGRRSTTSQGITDVISGDFRWGDSFVEATNRFKGPWPFQLFLGTLLAICEHETGFNNRINGNFHDEYPGKWSGLPAGTVPTKSANPEIFPQFAKLWANEGGDGYTNIDKAVGPMQLLTEGYKLFADRQFGSKVGDEFYGGRWNPHFNILAGGAALASKLGAGISISTDGKLSNVKVTGLSLSPTEANMWAGVSAYSGSTDPKVNSEFVDFVKKHYKNLYSTQIETDIASSDTGKNDDGGVIISTASSDKLRKQVLNNNLITFTRSSQSDDIKTGRIVDDVLKFMLAFTDAGFPIVVTAMRSDHTHLGPCSAHSWGKAVDMGNYGLDNPDTSKAMTWIRNHQSALGFSQMIGPYPDLVVPLGLYDATTLAEHKNHIHIGYACNECAKARAAGKCTDTA